jgi:hypothetical protein
MEYGQGSGGRISLRAFGAKLLSPAVNRRSRAGPARVNLLCTQSQILPLQ